MATSTGGLHERPTYNKLIQEIQHGEKIKLPNRDALFLRNSPYMAFLDGQGTTEMQEQQERKQKQEEVEHVVREQASKGGDSVSEIRVKNQMQETSAKVEKMLSGSGRPPPNDEEMAEAATGSGGPPPPPGAQGPWRKKGGGAGPIPKMEQSATGSGSPPPPPAQGKGKTRTPQKPEVPVSGVMEMGSSGSGGPPPPPPPAPPTAVPAQPIHVTNVTHLHVDPQIIHALNAEQVNQRTQMNRMAEKWAQHLTNEQQNKQRTNNRALALMEMGRAGEQQKRTAETELAGAPRPMPTATPAPIPTIQPTPAPIITPPPQVPTPIVDPALIPTSKVKGEPVRGRTKEKEDKEDRTRSRSSKSKASKQPTPKATPDEGMPQGQGTKKDKNNPATTDKPGKKQKKNPDEELTPEEKKLFDELYSNIKPRAKPKAKVKTRVKGEPTKKPEPANPFAKKKQDDKTEPDPVKIPVKLNPNINKKKSTPAPTNPGFTGHGTQMDKATDKAHWEGMGMQYIKEQLEKRGFKFKNTQFKGPGALKKRNLLDMLYRRDKIS